MTQGIGLVLAYGLLACADDADAAKKDYARFEGTWSFALVEVEGKKMPTAPFETDKIIIGADGNFVVVQGKRITHGSFKLDTGKTPKQLTFTFPTGPYKGKAVLGIYELDSDSYKVCTAPPDKDRPTEFATKPDSGCVYQILKREKQPVKEALVEVGRKELAGTWQAMTYELDGKKASDEDMKKIKLTIDADGKASAARDDKVFIASSTTIDPGKKPMTIDMTYTEGDPKGQTALGIYKIEDDVLTICRTAPDKARPTEFAAKAGSGHTLMTYKREKVAPK